MRPRLLPSRRTKGTVRRACFERDIVKLKLLGVGLLTLGLAACGGGSGSASGAAIAIDQGKASPLKKLADLYITQARFDDAISVLQGAERIEPGDEPGKTAPAALEAAQALVVEDRIELGADQRIKPRDVAIERAAADFRIGGEAQRCERPEPVGEGLGRRQKGE